jgi:hypothetical protein
MLGTVLATMLGRDERCALLHGPVLFLTADEEGDTRSLSPDQYARIMLAASLAKDSLTRAEALTAALAS